MGHTPVQEATVTDVLVRSITERASHVFGLIGNGNVSLVSALTTQGFPFTGVRHEASTISAADAYFRTTGTLAVATATYGAGFTNMATGLAEARIAHTPMVVVIGDAPAAGSRPFDVDQAAILAGLGVPAVTITPGNVSAAIDGAFERAETDQMPVAVLVPYDVANAPTQQTAEQVHEPSLERVATPTVSDQQLAQLAEALVAARRPLILVGGGVVRTKTGPLIRRLGDALGAVFMHSLTASNVVGDDHSLGIVGGFTPEHKLPAVRAADCVLILGATSNAFQTRHGTLFGTSNIFRLDLDDAWSVNLSEATTIFGDLNDAVPRLLRAVQHLQPTPSSYRDRLPELLGADGLRNEPMYGTDDRLNPRHVAHRLNAILPPNRQIVLDGGHFITWIGERIEIPDPAGMIAVGTAYQAIGLGFGAAVGATVASPHRCTVCITGDGGGQMGLADMATFVEHTDHGAVVVINDAAYGAELHQYAALGADPAAMLLPHMDFAALGQATGATGFTVDTIEDLDAFQHWLSRGTGVAVVNINVSTQFAHPALRPGATG